MKFILPIEPDSYSRENFRCQMDEKAIQAIEELPLDKVWEITIEEQKPRRSLSANRMMWATYETILQAGGEALAGWDKEDLHCYLLGEYGGWETVEALGRKKLKPLLRSSRMDKKTFAAYYEFIVRKMGEHGISL